MPDRIGQLRDRLYRTRRGLADRWFDRRHGVDTSGSFRPSDLAAASDAVEYQSTRAKDLREMVRDADIAVEDCTFVDLGAGKGRALLAAVDLGFPRVIGVELSASLCEIARRNVERYRGGRRLAIEVVEGDASTPPVPAGPVLFYLFNPFGDESVRRLVDTLAAAAQTRDAPLWVIYRTPRHAAWFDGSDRFDKVEERLRYCVYSARVGGRGTAAAAPRRAPDG